mmetsp:Transcript_97057/g.216486  ORF Transcript_97057/g.216486 Transcript_97057/m.216486 type:complete len:239 (-) Transcript_97057:245-961(-)
MHSDGAWLSFGNVQELAHYLPGWATAIQEVEIHVLYAVVDEAPSIVLLLVQANDKRNAGLAEDGHVVLGGEGRVAIIVRRVGARSGEREKLVGHYPIHVAIFNFLEELVGINIEPVPIEPAESDSLFDAFQAIQNGALVRADSTSSIAEGQERRIDIREGLEGNIRRFAHHDHLVSADQSDTIGPLLGVMGAVVNDTFVCQSRIGQFRLQHLAISVRHPQVEGAKVCEKGFVDQLRVD